jgi:hypothetical protein
MIPDHGDPERHRKRAREEDVAELMQRTDVLEKRMRRLKAILARVVTAEMATGAPFFNNKTDAATFRAAGCDVRSVVTVGEKTYELE